MAHSCWTTTTLGYDLTKTSLTEHNKTYCHNELEGVDYTIIVFSRKSVKALNR